MRSFLWIVAVIAAVALLVASLELIRRSVGDTKALAEAEAAHTYTLDVLIETERATTALLDAQRGLRGYIITRDSRYLEPFQIGIEEAPKRLARLRSLVAIDPADRTQADKLVADAQAALGVFKEGVALGQQNRWSEAVELVRSGAGKRHLDDARAAAEAIKRSAQHDRDVRRRAAAAAAAAAHRSAGVLAALGGALLILTIILGWLAMRSTARAQGATLAADASRRFLATFEQAAVGIAHVAPDGHWLRINDRFCDILGYTRDEMLASSFQTFTHPDDLDSDLEHIEDLLAGRRQHYTIEKRYFRKNGSIVWVNLTVSLVRDDARRPDYLVAVVEDISERKRAEQTLATREAALADSEAFLRSVLDASTDCIKVVDCEGRLRFINANGQCAMELDDIDQVIGAEWASIWPTESRRLIDGALEEAKRGRASQFEAFCPTAKGTARWWDVSVAPIRDEQGLTVKIVSVSRDVTERRRAIAELSAREAQLNTIVETVPVGLVMAEFPSGRIVGGNRFVEQMVRHPVLYSPDIHSYDEWVSFHEDGTRVDGHEYPLARMMLAGEANPSIEVHYQRGDGTRAWTLITGRPVRNEAGEMTGGVVALVDIDEERRAKRALEESLQAREVLLYEVNHRVKNSLQLVTALLLIEASKIADPAARGAIISAREKVATISKLHQRLYADGSHDTVDFATFLEDMVSSSVLSNSAQTRIKADVVDLGSQPLSIRLAAPLAMAASELVTNALKYAFPSGEGEIAVRIETPANEVRLSVADNGIGLGTGFDPYKASTTGMQIVTGLVRQVGGSLAVDSSAAGSVFTIVSPR